MKITFTCNKLGNGGAERVISNISNQMIKDGHDVRIVCLEKFDDFYYPLDEKTEIAELDKKISGRKNWFRRKFAGIINFIRLNKAIKGSDIVISFYTRQNCYSILACKIHKIPIICAERDHFFMYDGRVNRILRRICYPLADGFIHQTKMAQEYLRENCGIKCRDIVSPNPLWITDFSERKPERGFVTALGRLAEQKNYPEMIDAFALVHKQLPYAKLHIYGYGKGTEREQLTEQIKELGLENTVILEGLSNNVGEVLSKSEVFVMFSHGEGYPNALMEALAYGVPAVSSDCPVGGPRDMIDDGINGFLVPCGDKAMLAERIIELLKDEEKRNVFSSNAVKIRQTNNFMKIYDGWMKYIEAVIKSA